MHFRSRSVKSEISPLLCLRLPFHQCPSHGVENPVEEAPPLADLFWPEKLPSTGVSPIQLSYWTVVAQYLPKAVTLSAQRNRKSIFDRAFDSDLQRTDQSELSYSQ